MSDMAIYRIARSSVNHTAATPNWQLSAASGYRPRLLGFTLSIRSTATTWLLGLGRPATEGTGTSLITAWAHDDTNEPAVSWGGLYESWSSAPTAPTQFFRKYYSPTSSYVGCVWHFPRGLAIPSGTSVVGWNINATASTFFNFEVEA